MFEAGHTHMNNANLPLALDYAQEAAAIFQRVVETPLHSQILRCTKLVSVAHYHRQEYDLAVAAAGRSLAVAVQLGGFDCTEALTAHANASNILVGSGNVKEGLKHLRAMQFLMELMAGPNYTGLFGTYYKMGVHYHEVGRIEDALRFYTEAAGRRNDDVMMDCVLARSSAVALASLGRFKEACECENKSYRTYASFLGKDHDAAKASRVALEQFTRLALNKGMEEAVMQEKLLKECDADAVAEQIKADEEADANRKKKKKNKKKKKKSTANNPGATTSMD